MNMETMLQMHYAEHQIDANYSDHLFGVFSLFMGGFVLNILWRSCFWGEWMLHTEGETMQGVMCSWCPELWGAPKQQSRNWLQNPLGQGKGVSSSQARKSNAMKMGIVFLSFC